MKLISVISWKLFIDVSVTFQVQFWRLVYRVLLGPELRRQSRCFVQIVKLQADSCFCPLYAV